MNFRSCGWWVGLLRFNPHSPLLANELWLDPQHPRPAKPGVSIHIRHCWRMNCAQEPDQSRRTNQVSIHIRHCWRMNSAAPSRCAVPDRRFNPHSPLLANEFGSFSQQQDQAGRFNPHSPLLANELKSQHPRSSGRVGFNPHSPLLANELSGLA